MCLNIVSILVDEMPVAHGISLQCTSLIPMHNVNVKPGHIGSNDLQQYAFWRFYLENTSR